MQVTGVAETSLVALRLSEERACAGYLAARKVMVERAGRVAVLRGLTSKNPSRVDYRSEFGRAVEAHFEAVERTGTAWSSWQRAQLRTDQHWTATTGRVVGSGAHRSRAQAA